MRKLRVFFNNHWLSITITVTSIILIGFTIWGLSTLESFYRNMTLATIPLQLLLTVLNAFIFVYLYMTVFGRGFSGMKKNIIKMADINVRFKDVIGLEGAKKEAMEVVQLLKDRARVKRIGGKIVKGMLLVGPPGCGKTLLAKAIATEAGVPFINIAGSEFVEVFVGVGASRVRQLFKKARQMAYANGACIVFIDELDVIGRGRSFSFMGGGGETNSTQNQLLVEMDGLESNQHNILVIGATNASEDILDAALMRPGRFDRKIFVSRPNLKDREELLNYYLHKVKYDDNVDIKRLAQKLVYKSPADIENVVKEAALIAASRKGKEKLDKDDISEAVERIELGMETHLTMTPEQLEQTAYHEAGHALVLYYLHPTDDVFKATIKSRGEALGLVWHHPREELHTFNREKLLADVKVSLAGYASEKIKYGTTSTGVSSDFKHAMQIAHRMVWSYGMGSVVGDFSSIPEGEISDQIKEKLNMETVFVINECLGVVEKFLRQEWPIVEAFAKELISKQELDYDAIDTLLKALKASPESRVRSPELESGNQTPAI